MKGCREIPLFVVYIPTCLVNKTQIREVLNQIREGLNPNFLLENFAFILS